MSEINVDKNRIKNEVDQEIIKRLVVAKLLLKSEPIKIGEEEIDLRKCYINSNGIQKLYDYMSENGMPLDDIDEDKIIDRYIIPIVLPDGREANIEVHDTEMETKAEMMCFGKKNEGTLLVRDEIVDKTAEHSNNAIDCMQEQEALFPNSLTGLARQVSKGALIPESPKDIAENLELPGADKTDKTVSGKDANSNDKNVIDKENLPEGVEDDAANTTDDNKQIINECRLVQVVEVNEPKTVANNANKTTGINENGGKITLLRYAVAGITTKNAVLVVQGGQVLEREVANDEPFSALMFEISGSTVKELEDNKSKIIYTNIEGEKTICDMKKYPNDLSPDKKEQLKNELEKIDDELESIRNSDMPEDEKSKLYIKTNAKRIEIILKYGLSLPILENQIVQDIEKSKEQAEEGKEIDNGENKDSNEHVPGDHLNPYAEGRTLEDPK